MSLGYLPAQMSSFLRWKINLPAESWQFPLQLLPSQTKNAALDLLGPG